MYISITFEDLQDAPDAVRNWITSKIVGSETTPAEQPAEKKPKAKADSEPKEVAKPAPPPRSEVLAKAVALIESKGEDVLQEILNKLEIRRVKECPEDKLADLLAEIAIHA